MKKRSLLAIASVVPLVLGLAACSSPAGSSTSAAPKSLTLWDGFTQYDATSPWGKLITACQSKTGITIKRTADQAVADNLLQAATTGSTPDLVVLDNPFVAQFAKSGLLVDNDTSGLDASAQLANILAAGQLDGKTYGASIGSNTLALFYNTDLLKDAGVEPPTNWEELRSAVAKTTKGDVKGIAFSAINTEEGSFQFEPFFWGAGANLKDLSSSQAVEALTLWKDFIDEGQAAKADLTANQQDVRDQFLAKKAAFMVNGTWQLTALDAAKIGYGVVPIPAIDGGTAPSPLGGEFVEVVKSDDATQKAAATFADCMVQPANLGAWAEGQSYILPYADGAQAQADANPALVPWVEAVGAARGRTADLGADYPDTSKALWTAVQEALTGTKTPEQALQDAAASLG